MITTGTAIPQGKDRASCTATRMNRPNRRSPMPIGSMTQSIGQRWRQGPDQRSNQTQSAPQTFESPEAAVATAYAQYDRDISERWRK